MPVSVEDLKRWEAFGGQVHDANGRKTYMTPSGKKLKSWKEAQRLLERRNEGVFSNKYQLSAPASPLPCYFVILPERALTFTISTS